MDQVYLFFGKAWNGWVWFVDKLTTKWTIVIIGSLICFFIIFIFYKQNYERYSIKSS